MSPAAISSAVKSASSNRFRFVLPFAFQHFKPPSSFAEIFAILLSPASPSSVLISSSATSRSISASWASSPRRSGRGARPDEAGAEDAEERGSHRRGCARLASGRRAVRDGGERGQDEGGGAHRAWASLSCQIGTFPTDFLP